MSRDLFGWVGDKVTYIWAIDDAYGPSAYQFASDEAWNRVLFGNQDVYIHGLSQVDSNTSFLGPAGIDYAPDFVQGLRVFVADRANGRVVVASFDPAAKTLTPYAPTVEDPDLDGVTDVAILGSGPTGIYFYAVSVTGRVSFWVRGPSYPSGHKFWVYGTGGSGTGQFMAPKGICRGHTLGPDGESSYTMDFYVADGGNGRLVWLQNHASQGIYTEPTWMGAVTLPNGGKPLSCAVDHFGNVTVADSLNSRLVKYTWNLTYLDTYGTYGTGANNDNTLAHPHSVDVPFGYYEPTPMERVWFGDGRVITAEDWGTVSGGREHYFGINSTITSQPTDQSHQLTYFVTDHGSQVVSVVNSGGAVVRALVNDALAAPGPRTIAWDGYTDLGSLANNGYYNFRVSAVSGYGCDGSSWCDRTLTSSAFNWSGGTSPPPLSVDINGPTMMRPNVTCSWTATAQGGTPPYTFDWTADPYAQSFSETTSGSSTATFEGGETGASVNVSVTDADGASASGSWWAQVDENLNDNCQ